MSADPIRTELPLREVLASVRFADYWPPGSPELVRDFLVHEYDARTMPPLSLNRDDDGTLWVLGWRNDEHPLGMSLLEAARGHGLTPEERAWVMAMPSIHRGRFELGGGVHRSGSLWSLGGGRGEEG